MITLERARAAAPHWGGDVAAGMDRHEQDGHGRHERVLSAPSTGRPAGARR